MDQSRKYLAILLVAATYIVALFTLLVTTSAHSSREERLINDCRQCTELEKFYYRGLFPVTLNTTFCVWSSTLLPSDGIIISRACSVQECDRINIPQNLLRDIDCSLPHPLDENEQDII